MQSEWTKIAIPFTGGLDTKTALAVLPPTKLAVLENGVFTKTGSVKKRAGNDALPGEATSGVIVGNRRAVVSANHAPALVTNEAIYTQSSGLWDLRGKILPATFTAREVAHANRNQSAADCASTNGVTVVVWKYATNSLYFQCYDSSTHTPLSAITALATATADFPSAVAVGLNVLLTYVDTSTNDVKARIIKTNDLATSIATATVVTLCSDLSSQRLYSVAPGDDNYGYLVWRSDGTVSAAADSIALKRFNAFGTTSMNVEVSTDVTASNPVVAYNSYSGRLCVAWAGATFAAYRPYTASTMAPAAAQTTTALPNDRVAIIPTPQTLSASNDFCLAAQETAVSAADRTVDLLPIGGSTVLVRHAHLASHGFVLAGSGCIVLGHESRTGLQNSYYIYRSDALLVGALEQATATDQTSSGELPHMSGRSIALGFARSLDVDDYQTQSAHTGIRVYDFDDTGYVSSAVFGESCYLAGSQLWCFDGNQPVEGGFHMFPDVLEGSTTQSTAAGDFTAVDINNESLLDNTQYNYRFYYEWYNARGERCRSLPMQRSFVPDFASGEGEISIAIPTLRHTLKSVTYGREAEVSIVVYRTEGNASNVFYRVSSPDPTATGDNGYIANSFAADWVTFVDSMADAVLTTKERDMFSLANLLNSPIPGPKHVFSVQDRLHMAGGGVPTGAVLPSKLRTPGEMVEVALESVVQPSTELITALGAVNETVVAFTDRDAFALSGPGFNNNGGGQPFSYGHITSDVGCTDPGSIVEVPGGLMFKSRKGIYAMDQSFGVQYLGAPVEAYNANAVYAAHVVPDTNYVLFLSSTGDTLMFDYYYGQWGVFTAHRGYSACVVDGDYYYLRNDGTVYKRNTSSYTDAGAAVIMRVRTGRFRVREESQGQFRLRRFGVLGEYKSSHSLNIKIFYDREEFPRSDRTVDITQTINQSFWGSSATWGSDAYWGGSLGTDYRYLVRPRKDKCSQVAFEFSDVLTSAPGPSFELTELLLEIATMDNVASTSKARKV